MSKGRVKRWEFWSVLGLLGLMLSLLVPTTAWAQSDDAGLEETGVKPSRAYFSLMPWERIDTYAGGLVLSFTDLVLPGNAGLDLRVDRSYNSKGAVHWRIGPGLVRQADEVNSQVPQGNPVIITADGSEEKSFETDRTDVYRTLSYAEYDRRTQELRQPNGIVVTYGCYWSPTYENTRYPTKAEDAYGNTLTFSYDACVPEQAQRPLLQSIIQDLGNGQSRTVQFTHLDGRIHTMTYAGRTWTYSWNGDLLVSVQPPVGGAWVFGYTNSRVSSVTTPNGGVVEYTYLWDHVVVPGRHPTLVVSTRRSTGRAVPEGLWQFTYHGDSTDLDIHADSSNSTLRYFFSGDYPYGGDWGTVSTIETWAGSALLQTEDYRWRAGAPVGLADPDNPFVDPFSPLPASRSITRGGRTWTTTYTYRESDFNDYGQPATMTEVGELTRTRTFSYTHAFPSLYVRGKTTGMTVSVGGETFTIAQTITTEEYTITRVINPDGTLASETRRGLTTSYQYDDLGRETRHTPPLGHSTVTTYFSGSYTVSRGGYQVTTRLDGFGRSTGTSDSLGVNTQIAYDALGRRIYESYPYTGSLHDGVSYTYDALDRVVRTNKPDPDHPEPATLEVRRLYNGNTVEITDENGRTTVQTWDSFGSPESTRLTSVTDAQLKTTSYTYNALGKLTSVRPGGRSWTYDGYNLLASETHPESGRVTYTHTAGLLTRREDLNGVTNYRYDRNDRLTTVDKPGAAYDVSFEYDASDNRVLARNSHVSSTFDFDRANRLEERTDRVGGYAFITRFWYDDDDHLTGIDYSSGRQVRYELDASGRIVAVRQDGALLADQFAYHPSGALTSYKAANGGTHTISYDALNRVSGVNAAGVYHVTLGHDPVGNVTEIDDKTDMDHDNPLLEYDDLDRLWRVSGFGAVTYDYDDAGNRIRKTAGTFDVNYHYDPATNRLENTTGSQFAVFSYDAVGNTTQDGSGTYAYTPDNQIETATVGSQVRIHEYDADGVRTATQIGDAKRFYLHGPSLDVLSVFALTGGRLRLERDYIYAGSRLLASTDAVPGLMPPQPPPPPPPTGRYKLDDQGYCYWDPSDSGSNLCTPQLPGRYKRDAQGHCYWEPNDTGDNQCTPPPGRYELDQGGNCYWNYEGEGEDQCTPSPVTGRYKSDGAGGCYWDPTDSGPNQCLPPGGRYKMDGAGNCYWDPNDDGPNQCGPDSPPPSSSGRFKWSGSYCYWDPNDDGPDQCWPGGPPPSTYPSVALTSPAQGATFITGANITVAATASDPDGTISKVEFFNGSTLLATDTVAPYAFTWPAVANGTYTLTARATDNLGARKTSAPASITVGPPPNSLPTVNVTSPTAGATYYAPKLIPVTAAASDSDGTIVEVKFYAGSTLIGTDTIPPFSVTWSVSSGGAGTYQLTARARDNAGGIKQSAGVTVTIRPPTGRYKLDGSGRCYWDPNDSGPNQCSMGRWKLDGHGGCYWDANDSGPNQCSPGEALDGEEVRR